MKKTIRKSVALLLGMAMVMAMEVTAEGVSYERVADMLYLVMSADRAVYTHIWTPPVLQGLITH